MSFLVRHLGALGDTVSVGSQRVSNFQWVRKAKKHPLSQSMKRNGSSSSSESGAEEGEGGGWAYATNTLALRVEQNDVCIEK